MPIRARNLDLDSEFLKSRSEISLGDITATTRKQLFVAPFPCVVETVDLYSQQGVAGDSSVVATVAVSPGSASGTIIGSRGTSATAATSNDICATHRYRVDITSNNSLTAGAVLSLQVSAQGTAVLSSVIAHVTYKPRLRQGVR